MKRLGSGILDGESKSRPLDFCDDRDDAPMRLLTLMEVISASALPPDPPPSKRARFAERFSGDPRAGVEILSTPESAKTSKVEWKFSFGVNASSWMLNAGLHGRSSSVRPKCLMGELTICWIFLRWFRRLVLGETDGGGFAGFLNLITGVRGGGSMLT